MAGKVVDVYWIKGVKKETFFDEYESYEDIVTKGELIDLLRSPKATVYEVSRRILPAEEWDNISTAEKNELIEKIRPR